MELEIFAHNRVEFTQGTEQPNLSVCEGVTTVDQALDVALQLSLQLRGCQVHDSIFPQHTVQAAGALAFGLNITLVYDIDTPLSPKKSQQASLEIGKHESAQVGLALTHLRYASAITLTSRKIEYDWDGGIWKQDITQMLAQGTQLEPQNILLHSLPDDNPTALVQALEFQTSRLGIFGAAKDTKTRAFEVLLGHQGAKEFLKGESQRRKGLLDLDQQWGNLYPAMLAIAQHKCSTSNSILVVIDDTAMREATFQIAKIAEGHVIYISMEGDGLGSVKQFGKSLLAIGGYALRQRGIRPLHRNIRSTDSAY
ncbi:hypothetical protein JW766_01430 [Candidatus Dojkabacteria bacterium]|nr:hypothetical protein [Candidatus Dojkabacteria bacterium]